MFSKIKHEVPLINKSRILSSYSIEYPSEFNYRQTPNDCGPYNVAAVVRGLTGNEVDSSEYAKSIKWRLPNGYTLPWGMERQLKENGISIKIPNVKSLNDEDKIEFLREQLSQGKAVIILGEQEGYEHYITLFGFDNLQDEFYVYDSFYNKGEGNLTKDGNDNFPGNRNFTSQELLNFWRKGGMYGFYRWYIIVAENNENKDEENQ